MYHSIQKLTEAGKTLMPIISCMCTWGEVYYTKHVPCSDAKPSEK
ncbi:winged helix-turn-helix transcriptional regulator [Fusibacter sp. 3D3]